SVPQPVGIYPRTLAQDRAGNLYVACTTNLYRISRVDLAADAPPHATDDAGVVRPGTAVTLNVLGNDTDPDNDPLWIDSIGRPAHGTVARRFDGTLRYTPDGSSSASDSFAYTISDGRGGTATANVRITAPAPDLTVSALTASDRRPSEGTPVSVTATI